METKSNPSSLAFPRMARTDVIWIGYIAVGVYILDLLTKIWAVQTLRLAPPIQVIPGCLRLIYGENPGIAFGLFREHGGILHLLSPIAFVALLWIVYKQFAETAMDFGFRWIFGLLLGGALGNILNRLYCGYVIDFIEAYIGSHVWPTFNVADSALTVGEVILIGKLLFQRSQEPAVSDPTAGDASPIEVDAGAKNNMPHSDS